MSADTPSWAYAVVGIMSSTTSAEWDAPRIETFARQIANLDDPKAAEAAAWRVANTWTWTNPPSWAHFLEAYRGERRGVVHALPPYRGSPITVHEYLTLVLIPKIDEGSETAQHEWGNWRRHAQGGGLFSRTVQRIVASRPDLA